MKIRKCFLIKPYRRYSTNSRSRLSRYYEKNLNKEKETNIHRKHGNVCNKLKDHTSIFTKKEKRHILDTLYLDIVSRRKEQTEEWFGFYLNDIDVQKIIKEENIFSKNEKKERVNEIAEEEKRLILKFQNFYDLFHVSLIDIKNENKKIKSNPVVYAKEVEASTFALNQISNKKELHNSSITNVIDLIVKYLFFIEQNITQYDKTSHMFKTHFSQEKFVVSFFNFSYPYIKYFPLKLLLKYARVFIKLNCFTYSEFLRLIENKTLSVYSLQITEEDVLSFIFKNNQRALEMLEIISSRMELFRLSELCTCFVSFLNKSAVYGFIRSSSSTSNKIIHFEKFEKGEGSLCKIEELEACIRNHSIQLYVRSLFLMKRILTMHSLYIINIHKYVTHWLDCVIILCEYIFDDRLFNKKILENLEWYEKKNQEKNQIFRFQQNKEIINMTEEYMNQSCIFDLQKQIKNMLELCFNNITDHFILSDCDTILRYLQTMYVTKYRNAYLMNLLFYSLGLNTPFFKNYQIKNILFFFSLYKSYFLMNQIELQLTIYNSYNKRLLFELRRRLEIYSENSSLEHNMNSIMVLSDLLKYNKVINKIVCQKLRQLNFNNISTTEFRKIFFLIHKLRFNASTTLCSELFLRHYKKFIPYMNVLELVDLVRTIEFIISKKRRRIFLVLILHIIRKLQENTSSSFELNYGNHISELVRIIHKFQLYEYDKSECFVRLCSYVIYTDKKSEHQKLPNVTMEKDNSSSYFFQKKEVNALKEIQEVEENKESITNESNCKKPLCLLHEKSPSNVLMYDYKEENKTYGEYFKIKLELLNTNQIIEFLFFMIHTYFDINVIYELYTELFYRLHRNISFSRKEFALIFKSIRLSRVFHSDLFNTLMNILSNNKSLLSDLSFCIDVLFCFCSCKHKHKYDLFILWLFETLLSQIDIILHNLNQQTLFYYCFIYLEVYHPFLFLKVMRRLKETSKKTKVMEEMGRESLCKDNSTDLLAMNEHNLSSITLDSTLIHEVNQITDRYDNKMKKMNSGLSLLHVVSIIRNTFFEVQKKNTYSFDLFDFSELLQKLHIMKRTCGNTNILFLKNQEIDNLFVLPIYFPQLKFGIVFLKDQKKSKSVNVLSFQMNQIRNYKKEERQRIPTVGTPFITNKTKSGKENEEIIQNNMYAHLHSGNENLDTVEKLYLYKKYHVDILAIPYDRINGFFKNLDTKKQCDIINESNLLFEQVYKQITICKIKQDPFNLNVFTLLLKKQLQFIFFNFNLQK